jgi:hypothetical protein
VVQDQMQTATEPDAHASTEVDSPADAEQPERVVPSGEGVVRPVAIVDADVSTDPQDARPDASLDASRDVGVDRPL